MISSVIAIDCGLTTIDRRAKTAASRYGCVGEPWEAMDTQAAPRSAGRRTGYAERNCKEEKYEESRLFIVDGKTKGGWSPIRLGSTPVHPTDR